MRGPAPRLIAAAMVLAILVLGASACGTGDGSGGLTLKIGVLLPLTGERDVLGRSGGKAIDLAQRQVRSAIRKGGSFDVVRVQREDEGPDPGVAIKSAEQLKKDKTNCVVGPWSSTNMGATANQVFVPFDITVISPAASGDNIGQIRDADLLNRTVLADRDQGPALVELMDRELGGLRRKTVSIGAFKSNYGKNLVKSFTRSWRARGGRVSATAVYGDKSNYKPEVSRLTKPDPDAYVFFDGPGTFGRMLTPLTATKRLWKANKTWTTDQLASPNLALSPVLDGLRGVAPGAPDSGASARAFGRLWKKRSKIPRQSYDAQAFDAFILCYLSAVAAGSSTGHKIGKQLRSVSAPPGTKYTWQQLPQAIKALRRGEEIDYQGASGPIDLDSRGDVTRGTYDAFRFKHFRINVVGDVRYPPPGEASGSVKRKVKRRSR